MVERGRGEGQNQWHAFNAHIVHTSYIHPYIHTYIHIYTYRDRVAGRELASALPSPFAGRLIIINIFAEIN